MVLFLYSLPVHLYIPTFGKLVDFLMVNVGKYSSPMDAMGSEDVILTSWRLQEVPWDFGRSRDNLGGGVLSINLAALLWWDRENLADNSVWLWNNNHHIEKICFFFFCGLYAHNYKYICHRWSVCICYICFLDEHDLTTWCNVMLCHEVVLRLIAKPFRNVLDDLAAAQKTPIYTYIYSFEIHWNLHWKHFTCSKSLMVFAMQDCRKVIQDDLILYTSAILKLHLRSAILSLILHCIVPDQVTHWLVKQRWNSWNETFFLFFFFFQGIWEEDSVAKSHGSRLEVWIFSVNHPGTTEKHWKTNFHFWFLWFPR